MTEIAAGVYHVAHQLLEFCGVGKAAVALAVPDRLIVARDGEDAAGAGHQRDLAQISAEGRQQLLRHPAGAQQPVALRAVGDGDARSGLQHQAALSLAMVSSSTSKLA